MRRTVKGCLLVWYKNYNKNKAYLRTFNYTGAGDGIKFTELADKIANDNCNNGEEVIEYKLVMEGNNDILFCKRF